MCSIQSCSDVFYGIRVAIPSGTNKETVRLRYQARSVNFIRNKQAEAEALKILGPWDPVTIIDQKKDDPDHRYWKEPNRALPLRLASHWTAILLRHQATS